MKYILFCIFVLLITELSFGGEIDTLRVGHSSLNGAVLPTGRQIIRSYKRAGGTDTRINTNVQTIRKDKEGRLEVYRIMSQHISAATNDTTVSEIIIRAEDFALLHHRVKAQNDSMAVSCSGFHISGWVVLPPNPSLLIDSDLEHAVFPVGGPAPWLLSALPVQSGYHVVIPRYSPWQGGEVYSEIRVLGTEKLEHNGATLNCWKVDTGKLGPPGYRAIRWVDQSARKIVRSVLKGPQGKPEYWSESQDVGIGIKD